MCHVTLYKQGLSICYKTLSQRFVARSRNKCWLQLVIQPVICSVLLMSIHYAVSHEEVTRIISAREAPTSGRPIHEAF